MPNGLPFSRQGNCAAARRAGSKLTSRSGIAITRPKAARRRGIAGSFSDQEVLQASIREAADRRRSWVGKPCRAPEAPPTAYQASIDKTTGAMLSAKRHELCAL